jgi:hypothetical protein
MKVLKDPPEPTHVAGTQKGEELSQKRGQEPGREANAHGYRHARDATSINPKQREPIDPRMPEIPPA